VFHLALASEWKGGWANQPLNVVAPWGFDRRYTPSRFAADGFVHCCDDQASTLQVAAAYFAAASEVIVAELDEHALDVEVKREAPAPPDGTAHPHHDGRRFPHVYGTIPARAVLRVGALLRASDGSWRWPAQWASLGP
jgi:uncharacterized protein (DUF952 family)